MTQTKHDLQAAMHLARAAAQLIETAANRAEESEAAQDAIRSAAWRLADAAGILGTVAGRAELTGTGITDATGRGYTLPRKAPHDAPRIKLTGAIGGFQE